MKIFVTKTGDGSDAVFKLVTPDGEYTLTMVEVEALADQFTRAHCYQCDFDRTGKRRAAYATREKV